MSLMFKNGKEYFREVSGNKKLSMVVTGDCCPWGAGLDEIKAGRSKGIIEAVMPFISGADIKVMQLETPLTEKEAPIKKCGPNLKCPHETVELLQAGGFEVALLANNHTGDHGSAGVIDTVNLLEKSGIACVGAGKNIPDASLPLKMKREGIEIAFLNFAESEFGMATDTTPGYAPLDVLENIKAIKEAKSQSDIVFVIVHGGHERNPVPSPRMIKTYRAFVDAGASLVMNIHTHCPEGIEFYNNSPIVYCPGNFYLPWPALESHLSSLWWFGYLPKFYFDRDGVYAMEVMPYNFDNKCISLLKEDENEAFFNYLAQLCAIISNDDEVKKYFDAWVAKWGNNFLDIMKKGLNSFSGKLDCPEDVYNTLGLQNYFNCESHNDLITNYLRMIYQFRHEEAIKNYPLIDELRNPVFALDHWEKIKDYYKKNS